MKIALKSILTHYNAKLGRLAKAVMVLYHPTLLSRTLLALFLVVTPLLLVPGQKVLADQSNPDSTPQVSGSHLGINVYRNLLVTNDRLFLIYANIPYASTPTATESEAFIWQVLDTDGTTVLGQTTGYPYNDSGYGYNVYSMYFGSGITWQAAYTLRLIGNPSVFLTPPLYDYPVPSSAWSTLSTQEDEQNELESRIIVISSDLYNQWSLTPTTSLTMSTEAGTYLSPSGEAFWRGAVFGCQGLAPGVFQYTPLAVTSANHTGAAAYMATLQNQYTGSWIATAKQGGADFFGTSYDLLTTILIIVCCVAVMFMEQRISGNIWFGLVDAILLATLFMRQGLYDGTFLAAIGVLFWIYVSARVWGLVR